MKKLSVIGLLFAGAVALATPAQAAPCDKHIHIHTGEGIHICMDRPI